MFWSIHWCSRVFWGVLIDSKLFCIVLEGSESFFDILRCYEVFLWHWAVLKFPTDSEVFCDMFGFSEAFRCVVDIMGYFAAFSASDMSSKLFWKVPELAEASPELLECCEAFSWVPEIAKDPVALFDVVGCSEKCCHGFWKTPVRLELFTEVLEISEALLWLFSCSKTILKVLRHSLTLWSPLWRYSGFWGVLNFSNRS